MKNFVRLAMLIGLFSLSAQPAYTQELSDTQKEQVEALILNYLRENPDLIFELAIEGQEVYQAKQELAARQAVADQIERIETPADPQMIFGNPDGDVTIVEFFDYRCGFCKRAFAELMAEVESDAIIQLILQQCPI